MWEKIIDNNVETNYGISDNGEVRNDKTNKILSQRTQQGYKHVTLSISKKSKSFRVHRLVAIAYIPNPENKPCVNHIDGCRSNNLVSNLEWCTPAENTNHAVEIGLMKPSTQSAISHLIKGDKQTKTHKGFGWKLVDEIVH